MKLFAFAYLVLAAVVAYLLITNATQLSDNELLCVIVLLAMSVCAVGCVVLTDGAQLVDEDEYPLSAETVAAMAAHRDELDFDDEGNPDPSHRWMYDAEYDARLEAELHDRDMGYADDEALYTTEVVNQVPIDAGHRECPLEKLANEMRAKYPEPLRSGEIRVAGQLV